MGQTLKKEEDKFVDFLKRVDSGEFKDMDELLKACSRWETSQFEVSEVSLRCKGALHTYEIPFTICRMDNGWGLIIKNEQGKIVERLGIEDVLVSRIQHARIFCKAGKVMIEDMGAKNRTILNGKLLEAHNPTELVEGNTFTIGGTEFIIERFHREIKSISESGIHVWHTCKNALIQLCDLHLKENNFEGFLKQLQLLEDSTQKRLGKNVNEMLRDFIKNVKNILSSTGWLPQEWKNEWDRPSKVLIQA